MPVFCNALRVQRESEATLKAEICAWLNKKVGHGHKFTPSNLFNPLDIRVGRVDVSVVPAGLREPQTISISLRHPDETGVAGRRWETQLGIQVDDNSILFSLNLEHSDVNTRVTIDHPPGTSVPGVITKIAERCKLAPDTVGLTVKELTNDEGPVLAFSHVVHDQDRNYSVVVASADAEGEYGTQLERLQYQLAGIAQVVRIPRGVDTRTLADKLGRRIVPYGGAITVLRPPSRRRQAEDVAYILTRERIADLQSVENRRFNLVNSTIIERVSFISNGLSARHHISPALVRVKQQRDARVALRETMDNDLAKLITNIDKAVTSQQGTVNRSELDELQAKFAQERELYEAEMADQADQIAKLQADMADLDRLIADADDEIREATREAQNATATAESLKSALAEARRIGGGIDDETRYALQDLLTGAHKALTPAKCLKLIEAAYPERVVVLPEALASAEDSETYSKPLVLLDLLSRLATTYIDAMLSGGDSKARTVFTPSEYSANESDTVKNIDSLRKHREIPYKGERVMLERHLRNGNENNASLAIRVYFLWDADEGKVIVGYCGPHMPTATRHK